MGNELHEAAKINDLNTINQLLTQGVDVNQATQTGVEATPIFYAAEYGHYEAFMLLLEKGAKVNIKNNKKQTPLHDAAYGGNLNIVKKLHELGLSCNEVDNDYMTPMQWATFKGHLEVMQYLHDVGGIAYNITDIIGSTLMHEAALGGQINIMKYLHEVGGLDYSVLNKSHTTPLHYAVSRLKIESVSFLAKEAPGSLNIISKSIDYEGQTALHTAVNKALKASVETFEAAKTIILLLFGNGANPDIINPKTRQTVLELANNNPEIFYLLTTKADVIIKKLVFDNKELIEKVLSDPVLFSKTILMELENETSKEVESKELQLGQALSDEIDCLKSFYGIKRLYRLSYYNKLFEIENNIKLVNESYDYYELEPIRLSLSKQEEEIILNIILNLSRFNKAIFHEIQKTNYVDKDTMPFHSEPKTKAIYFKYKRSPKTSSSFFQPAVHEAEKQTNLSAINQHVDQQDNLNKGSKFIY